MKYLCLAYSDDQKWNALPRSERSALQEYDEVLRKQGHVVVAVQPVTSLQFTDEAAQTCPGSLAPMKQEMAGFYIIEAKDLNEVIQLLSETPCAEVGAYRDSGR